VKSGLGPHDAGNGTGYDANMNTIMIRWLSLVSLLLAALAVLTPMLPGFLPRMGLLPLYRMRLIRALLLGAAWGLAIVAGIQAHSSFVALPFVLLLSIPALVMEPQRIFVALDDPAHVPASQAKLAEGALVLGYDMGQAMAWPFAILVPRHLINDHRGDIPLLVAY